MIPRPVKRRLLATWPVEAYVLPRLAARAYRRERRGVDEIELSVVEDVREVAAERGWTYRRCLQAGVEARPPSHALAEDVLELVRHGPRLIRRHSATIGSRSEDAAEIYFSNLLAETRYPVPETFSCQIPNVLIHAPEGAIVTPAGELIAQSVFGRHRARLERPPVHTSALPGLHVSLLTWDGDRNYAHWLLDALPRLAMLDRPPSHPCLVPDPLLPFHRELLELLGIGGAQLVPVRPGWVAVEAVLLLRPAERSIVPRREHIAELRRRLTEAAGCPPGPADRRLYISRSASRRSLLNESELMPVLERHGFEAVHPEELSVDEQVRVFAAATVLVGYHGAGSYNALFMPPGGDLVEVLNPRLFDHGAARMAAQIGLRHWFTLADDAGSGRDATLDPEKLDRLLAYVVGDSRVVDRRY
jgi:capsular polysaccharide biosynthesis protein